MAYNIIQLKELMDQEYDLSKLFSTFSSINEDVENFLLNKSEQFEAMDLARTYLIFSKYRGENILAGYYSITNKPLMMSKKNFARLSSTLRKRLLGQIGKNFNYKNSISGTDILKLSYITVSQVYQLIGGRIIYLEVDNNDKLRSFYTNNGFKEIDNYRTPNDQCLFIKRISDIL